MGVGGPAALLLWPHTVEDMVALTGWLGTRRLPWRILGGGSNLLVADTGVPDAVVHTGRLLADEEWRDDSVRVAAGTPMAQALRRAVEHGRDGLVWAAGLPGSVGGAAAGNAGCWDSDMARSVVELEIVDGHGRWHCVAGEQLDWSYRRLDLPVRLPRPLAICSVSIATATADSGQLKQRYLGLQERKRARQPVGARNSGCVFRNPGGTRTAGQLLEEAGCKGLRVNDAQVSTMHANFVVNRGAARCHDVLALIERMRQRVFERSGLTLRQEIRQW